MQLILCYAISIGGMGTMPPIEISIEARPNLASVRSPTSAYRTLHGAQPSIVVANITELHIVARPNHRKAYTLSHRWRANGRCGIRLHRVIRTHCIHSYTVKFHLFTGLIER
jgi:hypothetical protein